MEVHHPSASAHCLMTPWGMGLGLHFLLCVLCQSFWPLELHAFHPRAQDGAGMQQVTSAPSLRTSTRYRLGQILRIGSP